MKAKELKELAGQVIRLLQSKRSDEAVSLVYDAAARKIPFSVLNSLGVAIGRGCRGTPGRWATPCTRSTTSRCLGNG